MIGPVDYSSATAPPAYRCADCGVAGVKLYTSVPDDAVAWWKRLPTRLPP